MSRFFWSKVFFIGVVLLINANTVFANSLPWAGEQTNSVTLNLTTNQKKYSATGDIKIKVTLYGLTDVQTLGVGGISELDVRVADSSGHNVAPVAK